MASLRFEPLIIVTDQHRIEGTVAVPTVGRNRLSDYANDPDREFFAITDARMSSLDTPDRVELIDFVMVARRQIVLVMPGAVTD